MAPDFTMDTAHDLGMSIMTAMQKHDPRPMQNYDACYAADVNMYGHTTIKAANHDDAAALAGWLPTMHDCALQYGEDQHSERLVYLETDDDEREIIAEDIDLDHKYSPWFRASRFEDALRDINAALVANHNSEPDAMAACLEAITPIVHKALHNG